MTVKEMIAELQKMDENAEIEVNSIICGRMEEGGVELFIEYVEQKEDGSCLIFCAE